MYTAIPVFNSLFSIPNSLFPIPDNVVGPHDHLVYQYGKRLWARILDKRASVLGRGRGRGRKEVAKDSRVVPRDRKPFLPFALTVSVALFPGTQKALASVTKMSARDLRDSGRNVIFT